MNATSSQGSLYSRIVKDVTALVLESVREQETVEKLITLSASGRALGVADYKIRRFAKLGLFPIYKIGNGRKLVRLSEVVAAVERYRQGGEK